MISEVGRKKALSTEFLSKVAHFYELILKAFVLFSIKSF